MMLAAALLLAAPAGPLAAFEAWTGQCWVADIAPDTTDRHCFARVYDGAHVRDSHVVMSKGQSVYAGETLYSATGDGIVFTYWNSLGGVGHGTAARAADGALTFTLAMRATPAAKPETFVTIWRRTATGYDTDTAGTVRHFRKEKSR